jgi:hypothetical protein
MGIAFWFYIKTDAIITNRIKYPVKIKTTESLIMTNASPDSITLKVTGKIRLQRILIKGIKSDPEKVTVKGPKSIIKDINYLFPDSIPVGNITTITLENKLIRVIPDRIRIKR